MKDQPNIGLKLLLSLGLLTLASADSTMSAACNYKMFPIFAGGSKIEDVRALEVDPSTNWIYVGGQSQSADFAPAENPHGYVYAVSPDGEWMWGNFFYNVSYAVSEIDGIILSQFGTYLSIIGQANNKPIIMELSNDMGQI